MLRRTAMALGVLTAPVTYMLGRLIGSDAFAAKSIQFDNHYLRGYSTLLKSQNVNSEMFSRFTQAARICASANKSIDTEMLQLFPNSHGQLLQDVVCMLLQNTKRGGYFVEVGVGNGTKHSNSLMLERDFGWSGILAEPAKVFHDAIATSRTSILDGRAISERTGDLLVFEQDDKIGELSGLAGIRRPRGTQTLSTYEVKTVRFDELLEEHNAPDEIDYISIDTEGSELFVLKGLSLTRRRVNFFTIEHNFDTERKKQYDKILLAAGYIEILPHLSGFDAWYAHKDLSFGLFSEQG
jgi:FkbM family methyltransferase